jgi:hypothetical protein
MTTEEPMHGKRKATGIPSSLTRSFRVAALALATTAKRPEAAARTTAAS